MDSKRLADDEARLLHDGDTVTFSALPFDRRRNPDGYARLFDGCTLGGQNALEFAYCEHTPDTPAERLSPVRQVIREATDELLRIRRAVRSVRHLACVHIDC